MILSLEINSFLSCFTLCELVHRAPGLSCDKPAILKLLYLRNEITLIECQGAYFLAKHNYRASTDYLKKIKKIGIVTYENQLFHDITLFYIAYFSRIWPWRDWGGSHIFIYIISRFKADFIIKIVTLKVKYLSSIQA